jgi:3-hydroxyacyl-[acyl-carrier-protein] dehydratase
MGEKEKTVLHSVMAPTDNPSETPENPTVPMKVEEIMAAIPHRYPFLLVDRVTEHELGKRIRGYKNVTMNEPFFNGHFPNKPIMPGVLQVEAMAQLAGIMVAAIPEGRGKLGLFAGIDEVRFRRIVVPGDRLDMSVEMVRLRLPICKVTCRAEVNGEVAVEGALMFTLLDEKSV